MSTTKKPETELSNYLAMYAGRDGDTSLFSVVFAVDSLEEARDHVANYHHGWRDAIQADLAPDGIWDAIDDPDNGDAAFDMLRETATELGWKLADTLDNGIELYTRAPVHQGSVLNVGDYVQPLAPDADESGPEPELVPATMELAWRVVPERCTLASRIRTAAFGNLTVKEARNSLDLDDIHCDEIYQLRYALECETGQPYKSDAAYALLLRYLVASPRVDSLEFIDDGLLVRSRGGLRSSAQDREGTPISETVLDAVMRPSNQ